METIFAKCVIKSGFIRSFKDKLTGRNYLATCQPAPLLSIRVEEQIFHPDSMTWKGSVMALYYNAVEAKVRINVCVRDTHFTFEIISIDCKRRLELVVWGPYPTTIDQIIGDTVGVVRNETFAIGIQALNPKTLGGFPETGDDITKSYSIFDQDSFADISENHRQEQIFRGNTAKGTDFGSVLQAYCRNRDFEQVIPNWNYETYTVPPFNDGGIIGSRISLFACPAEKALDIIGEIEICEGLPHPTINGNWAKQVYDATASYLIADFGEHNVDQAIDLVRKAGLSYLYHSSPFDTWGHFELKSNLFPQGWKSFKNCVNIAGSSDVKIGFHTLSNFVTTNDSYVAPVPDKRLARIGSAKLVASIDEVQTEISIDDPMFFKSDTVLNAIIIGNELVSYENISDEAPWKLMGCSRGAWGTVATSHTRDSIVGKLADHDYKVFLTDIGLSKEIAERIADFCMQTGAAQLSFDGLEGNFSTGLGQYGRTLFTTSWYERLDSQLKGTIINDASNPGHFNWHVYTRMNWGEPWYAGFRESQTQYRLKNQDYFSRNLMPHMLGWFALREETSVEDAEWLLARAAGFDAGFALAMSLDSNAQQAADGSSVGKISENTENILEAISLWETARMSKAFPEDIKLNLQDINQEFHLDEIPGIKNQWELLPIYSHKEHFRLIGNTTSRHSATICKLDNPYHDQYLSFILEVRGKHVVSELTIITPSNQYIHIDRQLEPGSVAKFVNKGDIIFYSKQWQEFGRQNIEPNHLWVAKGSQDIQINASVPGKVADINVEFRTAGEPIRLKSRNR